MHTHNFYYVCMCLYVCTCVYTFVLVLCACVRVDILCTFSYCVSYFVPMVFLLIESFYLACGEPPAVVISYVSNALLPYIFGVAFQPLYASYSFSPILLRLLCFFFGFFSELLRFSLLSDDNGFSLVCSIFAIVLKNSLLTLFRAPYLLYQSVCLLVSISLPVCRLSFHPAICLIHSHSQPFSNSLPLVFTIYLLPISLFLSVCLSVNLSLISAIYFSCCVCLFWGNLHFHVSISMKNYSNLSDICRPLFYLFSLSLRTALRATFSMAETTAAAIYCFQ